MLSLFIFSSRPAMLPSPARKYRHVSLHPLVTDNTTPVIMQLSAFAFYGEPDFLPTTAGSLCQNPHSGPFLP